MQPEWAGSLRGVRYTAQQLSESLFAVHGPDGAGVTMTGQQLAGFHTACAIDSLCRGLPTQLDIARATHTNDLFVEYLMGRPLRSNEPSPLDFWDRELHATSLRHWVLKVALTAAPAGSKDADGLVERVGGLCMATLFAIRGLCLVSSGERWPSLRDQPAASELLARLRDHAGTPPPVVDELVLDRGLILNPGWKPPASVEPGEWRELHLHGAVVRAEPVRLHVSGRVEIRLGTGTIRSRLGGWELFRLVWALRRIGDHVDFLEMAATLSGLASPDEANGHVLRRLEQMARELSE